MSIIVVKSIKRWKRKKITVFEHKNLLPTIGFPRMSIWSFSERFSPNVETRAHQGVCIGRWRRWTPMVRLWWPTLFHSSIYILTKFPHLEIIKQCVHKTILFTPSIQIEELILNILFEILIDYFWSLINLIF